MLEALKAGKSRFTSLKIAGGVKHNKLELIRRAASDAGVPVEIIDRKELAQLCGTDRHQGLVGLLDEYRYADLDGILATWRRSGEKALFLMLDGITDPQNFGSLVRSAEGAGVHGVIIPKDRSAQISPGGAKAAAGALEYVNIARVSNLVRGIERLRKEGIWVVGTSGDSTRPIFQEDLTMDLCIVIGGENKGIRPIVKKNCDFIVSIPMKGELSSYNASVSGGIILYETLRQRNCKM